MTTCVTESFISETCLIPRIFSQFEMFCEVQPGQTASDSRSPSMRMTRFLRDMVAKLEIKTGK